jgi:periplasmic protein CpxP/Spy
MRTDTKHECQSLFSQASGIPTAIICTVIFASFVGGLAFAVPVNAAPANDAPQQIAMNETASTKHGYEHGPKMDHSPEAMARRVEERIKTLHDKLGITSEQEAKWGDVAQTMRNNEAAIAALIETRRNNAKDMTAIDDLQSYEDITQAHADGIKKLIASFQTLYADMPDEQKKVADEAFGRFEGHRGDKSARKHK